jgi:hypothetical protein
MRPTNVATPTPPFPVPQSQETALGGLTETTDLEALREESLVRQGLSLLHRPLTYCYRSLYSCLSRSLAFCIPHSGALERKTILGPVLDMVVLTLCFGF